MTQGTAARGDNGISINLSREHAKYISDVEECFKDLNVSVSASIVRLSAEELPMKVLIFLGGSIASGAVYELLKIGIRKVYQKFKKVYVVIRHEGIMFSVSLDGEVNAVVVPELVERYKNIKTLDDLIEYLKSGNEQNGWVETTLGEVGKVITGKTPSKNNPEYWGEYLDFITPTDFKSNSKYLSKIDRRLSEKGGSAFFRLLIPANSVVVTCIGSDMGKVVINKNDCVTNQQINSLIISESFDANFVFYLLKNSHKILRQHAEGGGSTMPIINKTSFQNLSFSFPSLPEQRTIAAVLSSLDDKIELLREQNKTLEDTVQAIFKEWFVKFNYPGATGKMVDSELGEIPEGWRVGNIGEHVKIRGGGTPSTKNIEFWNGDTAWTRPKDLSNSIDAFLLKTEKKITKEGLKQISSGLLPKGTLLLSSRAPIGYLAISNLEIAINQGYIALLPDQYLSNFFMFLWLKQNMKSIINAANGSTFLEISKSSFKIIDCITPSKEILDRFDITIQPFFKKILNNTFQIQTLSTLRDILLPRLMRGDVKIKFN